MPVLMMIIKGRAGKRGAPDREERTMNGFKRNIRRTVAAALVALLLMTSSAVPAMAEAFSAIVTSKTMQVYSDASMTDVLGILEKNAVVRVMGYSNTIAKIAYLNRIGYAKVSDMKRVDAIATRVMTTGEAPIFQQPDPESVSVTIPAGTMLNLIATSGEWAYVEKDGVAGYMKTGFLQDAVDTPQTAAPAQDAPATPAPTAENGITVRTYSALTLETTKVYRAASEKAKVKTTLKPGVQVTVLATSSNGWAYIQANDKRGFCKLASLREGTTVDYVAPTPTPDAQGQTGIPAVVSAISLPVYQKANADSPLLGTLKQGQSVTVLKWNGEWAYIELNGQYGFCAISGLARADAMPTAAPSSSLEGARRGTVKASGLAVYRTASTKGAKLGALKKGQVVNVVNTSNGWAYIELNGQYGFCKASGLTIDTQEEGVPAGFRQANLTATVVMPDTRAYASMNSDAENVALPLGSEVQVVGYNDGWACITRDGSYAFVALKALSKASFDPISSDGPELEALVKALLVGGYYDSTPSASYNAAAISAIKRFQSACGLAQTGIADQNMLRIVYSGYAPVSELLYKTLAKGERSDYVSRLQARLYALGYLSKTGSLTGEYSATTAAAVKLFQNASGITATGTADPATLKTLYSLDAKKLPSGAKSADAGSTSGSGSSSTYLGQVPDGLASTTNSYSSSMSNAEKLEYAIYLAQGALGCPYVYGATGPEKFDCSGLTCYIFKAVGVKLERTAYNQGYDDSYPKIEGAQNLKRGDVVFFNTISDSDLSDHAGVYLGEGYFIHASSGAHKVVVSNLNTGYYGRVFSWGRRILK